MQLSLSALHWTSAQTSILKPHHWQLPLGLIGLVSLDQLGRWLVRAANLPVPGSIVGMLLLFVLVSSGAIPLARIRPASDLLIRHLALLYVPAGVAIILYASAVRYSAAAITVAALASLISTMLFVGFVVQRMGKHTS